MFIRGKKTLKIANVDGFFSRGKIKRKEQIIEKFPTY